MRFPTFLPRLLMPSLLAVGSVVFIAGCQVHATQAAVAQSAAPDTLSQLRALAADRGCTDDGQCHSLALGATPCGGPDAYLAWSSAHTSPDTIRALGKQYEAERRDANGRSGMMSTCRFTPDPGAVCRAGVCELGAAAIGAR